MPNMQNKKGKSKNIQPFVQLFVWLLRSEAWLSLTPQARAVYVELHSWYNGSNNGRIGLSVRRAAQRCRVAKDTAARAFDELIDRGFIECTSKGAFSLKVRHASEWRLTHINCDKTGRTKDAAFMKWRQEKQNPVPIQAATVPNEGQICDQVLEVAA